MRSSLLKNFLVVFLFWWLVLAVWWSFHPASYTVSAQKIASMWDMLTFGAWSPVPPELPNITTFSLKRLDLVIFSITYWVVPLIVLTGIAFVIGGGRVWLTARKSHADRAAREQGGGGWRSIGITLGAFPTPVMLKRDALDLGLEPNSEVPALRGITPVQIKLLNEIMGTISAYPDAFCGDGHGVSLFDHTLGVMEKIAEDPTAGPLSLITAAAHDMGKITAYTKDSTSGEWKRIKWHDKESARHLALLPAWWEMPDADRMSVLMAVKYGHTPGAMPDLDTEGQTLNTALKILDGVHEADTSTTRDEKRKVLDKTDIPGALYEAFIDNLAVLPFQTPGLPKGVKAVGWKTKSRIYLLEIKLRETLMPKLDPDLRAALGGIYREKTKVTPFTLELLKALEGRGWLIREIDQMKLDIKEALWKIKAGNLEFKGVLILDVPIEFQEKLPSQDTLYPLTVIGPLYDQPGTLFTNDGDLDGILSKPKPKPKEPVPDSSLNS